MNTVARIADSSHAKSMALALVRLGLCTLVSTVSVADPIRGMVTATRVIVDDQQ
jgi:hypothetical protein